MTKVYLKLFLGFWCITVLILVGTGLVSHLLDLRPDKHLSSKQKFHQSTAAERLLKEVVREAVNYKLEDIRQGMQEMPENAIRLVFVIDENHRDLLYRPLPNGIEKILAQLDITHPEVKFQHDEASYFGRFLLLPDGTGIKIVTRDSPDDTGLWWQLYFYNIWLPLLISISISGAACLILAKRLSRGIDILRNATRRIAAGDLSVRVSHKFNVFNKKRRDEIADLSLEFDHMVMRLDKSMQEQQRLIKDVSHELRSPLARLQFALALAQQKCMGDVEPELDKVKQAADYLNDIISDILSLPMTDTAAWELTDAIDLKTLLETLVDDYRAQASEKEVSLVLHTPINDALVATHGNSLIGVFENIIRNALHYTPKGSTVSLELDNSSKNTFTLEVRDMGKGVPADNLDDIFKPFFRTDEARARSSGGHGLGLAIAKRTVELHDGTISARNHQNGGLCISVSLNKGDF